MDAIEAYERSRNASANQTRWTLLQLLEHKTLPNCGDEIVKETDSGLALVVPSCDTYADVWPALTSAINKFWPARDIPKYLVTNNTRPQFDGFSNIAVGNDVSWSDNLKNALEVIPFDYVLLNIDDLILIDEVNHSQVMATFDKFVKARGNYLRLNPTPPGRYSIDELCPVPPGDVYRSSTVFSVWRKDVLRNVLCSGENAWEFEIAGSRRTDTYDGWYAVKRPMFKYVNLLLKGKVDPRAVREIRTSGVDYTSARKVLSPLELNIRRMRELRTRMFTLVPPAIRRPIRNVFSAS